MPILATTATATPVVREDIVTSLRAFLHVVFVQAAYSERHCDAGLVNPVRVISTFNRPNLHYAVHMKVV